MEQVFWILAGLMIGGFSFWLRGSAKFEEWFGRGKTTGDLVWAAILTLLFLGATYVGAAWWVYPALLVGFFLGGRLPWWRSLSMCRNPADGDCCWCLWLRHTARGVLWVAAAVIVLFVGGYNPWYLLGAGLLCAPCWELGWRTYPERATEVGEAVFGALIGIGLVASTF